MGALGTGKKSIDDVSDSSLQKLVISFGCKSEEELDRKLKSENIFMIPCACCGRVHHISKMKPISGDYYCKKCGG
jgi:rRNA maturation endonuclease Nob1